MNSQHIAAFGYNFHFSVNVFILNCGLIYFQHVLEILNCIWVNALEEREFETFLHPPPHHWKFSDIWRKKISESCVFIPGIWTLTQMYTSYVHTCACMLIFLYPANFLILPPKAKVFLWVECRLFHIIFIRGLPFILLQLSFQKRLHISQNGSNTMYMYPMHPNKCTRNKKLMLQ